MSVAQKLCNEIVEPAFKPSTEFQHNANTSTHQKLERSIINSNCRHSNKMTKSIVIEKKKIVNKLDPHDVNSKSKIILNQYKSKEILRKKLANIAVNTIVTGPLKCDNDCVTLVRKRDKDNQGSCKCSIRHSSKLNAKQIQTLNMKDYSFADKACAAHHVETTTCGTQFMVKSGLTPQISTKITKSGHSNDTKPLHNGFIELRRSIPATSYNDTPLLGYMGARRWALTRYPTRGPDF